MVAKASSLAKMIALTKKADKPKEEKQPKIGPTPERAARGRHVDMAMARRFVPMIDQLHRTDANPKGVLTDAEYKALGYYRDQASLAERSPVKSCLDFSPGGGMGPGVAIISAQRETHRMERDMGALAGLVRAVARDDISLSEWTASRYGSAATQTHIGIATLELKYAAGAIIQPE